MVSVIPPAVVHKRWELDVGWRGHASLVLHVRSQHVWIRAAVQHRLLSTRWVLRALRAMRLVLSADQVL